MTNLPIAFLSGVVVGWLAGRSITKQIDRAVLLLMIKHGVITYSVAKADATIEKLKRGE